MMDLYTLVVSLPASALLEGGRTTSGRRGSSFDKHVLSERSSFDGLRMSGSRRAQDERSR